MKDLEFWARIYIAAIAANVHESHAEYLANVSLEKFEEKRRELFTLTPSAGPK